MTEREDWTGRQLELEVGPVAHGGHCVARHDGRVVFVRHALPGERVVAEVTEDRHKSFCRADALEIVRADDRRVTPPCPLAVPGGCGGCDWQHAAPSLQRELKAAVVAEQLHRLAGIDTDVVVEPLEPAPLGWRSRVRLAVGRNGKAGLRAHRSHTVVPLQGFGCPIAVPEMLDGVLARKWRPRAEVEVTVDGDAQVHVQVIEQVRGRTRRRQLAGGRAREHAAGRDWQLAAHGFWQAHPAAADTYARVVAEYAQAEPGSHAWDLYAGVGLFASVLAEQVGEQGSVLAVESSRSAVADGERNLSDLPHVRWRAERVERMVQTEAGDPQVVVLDPPRKGAGVEVARAIAERRPARVVYVACDPAALARDVATFIEAGYRLADLRAFDAFPMTHHVECIALLTAS
jgi:tRNA/tmRNA/rRNA uracil-C5-methylase (TrmA/RlmC/RlmD family)